MKNRNNVKAPQAGRKTHPKKDQTTCVKQDGTAKMIMKQKIQPETTAVVVATKQDYM